MMTDLVGVLPVEGLDLLPQLRGRALHMEARLQHRHNHDETTTVRQRSAWPKC